MTLASFEQTGVACEKCAVEQVSGDAKGRLRVKSRDSNLNDSRTHSGYGHNDVLVSTAITRRVLCKQDHVVRCFKDFRRAAFVDENRRAGPQERYRQSAEFALCRVLLSPVREPSQPPPPGAGVRAATRATMRSKSAFETAF